MNEFEELMHVADRLHAPDGCPWDIKQTFASLQPYVLEEAHELLEAVDENETGHIVEELGDLLYTVIFYAKVAERQGRFSIREVLHGQKEKLIRRHPHVFGNRTLKSDEEISAMWEEVKRQEKKERKSALDRIPKGLDILAKAQKVIEKVDKHDLVHFLPEVKEGEINEEMIGAELLRVIYLAVRHKIDLVGALRRHLTTIEKKYRAWEEKEVQKID